MKKTLEHLQKTDPERAAVFKSAAQPAIKKVLETFKDWDFYTGESMNEDGMVALLNYREDGVTPYMLFFRDGLTEEKVVSVSDTYVYQNQFSFPSSFPPSLSLSLPLSLSLSL